MSEVITKFLNRDSKVNSLVLDPSTNTALIKDSSGEIAARLYNGQWDPSIGYNDYVLNNNTIYSDTLEKSYNNLSAIDQRKLSIYTSNNNIKKATVSNVTPNTIKDGGGPPLPFIDRETGIDSRTGRPYKDKSGRDGSEVNNPKKAWE